MGMILDYPKGPSAITEVLRKKDEKFRVGKRFEDAAFEAAAFEDGAMAIGRGIWVASRG